LKTAAESDAFYIIECGQVEVWEPKKSDSATTSNGNNNSPESQQGRLLVSLVRGEYFGESALRVSSACDHRSANVIAKTYCHLLALTAQHMRETMGPEGITAQLPLEADLQKVQKYRPFIRELLCKSFLFRHLKPDQVEVVATLIDEERYFRKNQVVFRQGDMDGSLYLIKQGSIRLSKALPDDASVEVEFLRLGVGECFGELALITGLPRSASATANEDSMLLELRRDNFTSLLNRYSNIRFHIANLVEQRLEESKRVTSELSKRSLSPNPVSNTARLNKTVSDSKLLRAPSSSDS